MHTLSQWNLSNGPFSVGSQYTPRIYRWLGSQGTKCWSRNVRWIHRVKWPMLACHCWASKLAGWNLGWALRQWIIALPELKCEGLGSMFLIFHTKSLLFYFILHSCEVMPFCSIFATQFSSPCCSRASTKALNDVTEKCTKLVGDVLNVWFLRLEIESTLQAARQSMA